MSSKRPREDDATASRPKKPRTAFKVGPDNLPDGSWRRKVIKIKKGLIHKAKVKKSYAKIKAREPHVDMPNPQEANKPQSPQPEPSQALHPERQAMLDEPQDRITPFQPPRRPESVRKREQKPGYFQKQEEFAAKKKAEFEARRLEAERRENERRQKIKERERYRSLMAKARTGGRNGQRKLGRESEVLLEKVKMAVSSPG